MTLADEAVKGFLVILGRLLLVKEGVEIGFESINVDLIYGLPHQTAESFSDTVNKIITMNPERIAVFSYAHVPWLKKQQGSFARFLPGPYHVPLAFFLPQFVPLILLIFWIIRVQFTGWFRQRSSTFSIS